MYRSSAGYRIIINEGIREDLKLTYISEVMNAVSKETPTRLGEKMSVIPIENSKENSARFYISYCTFICFLPSSSFLSCTVYFFLLS
jgi:hypothetical protein